MADLDAELIARIAQRAAGQRVFLVGISGGVAAGKSTLARTLADGLEAADLSVQIVATDGFLKPNAVLEAAGLGMKKGFPETYDQAAFNAFVAALAEGRPASAPVYSHVTYDVAPGETLVIVPAGVVIIEGINVLQAAQARARLDLSVYIDADPNHAKAWYLDRLRRIIVDDPASFFANLEPEHRDALFENAWTHLNLVNLHQYIAPTRAHADVVVRKGPDHAMQGLDWR
jgi:type I pantothenate kinase